MSHLLTISDLTIAFTGDTGTHEVTDHLSLTLDEGEVVCLVGESGCGKSVTSMSLLGLLGPGGSVKEGSICYEDRDLLTLSEKELDQIRGKEISMIFQDPYSSLNPRKHIYEILAAPMLYHGISDRQTVEKDVKELLEMVGMPQSALGRYPHEFSGGQRQRIGIARALSLKPEFIVCDEPVSALDVSVQAQILNLLKSLQNELQLTLLFIGHGLGAVHYVSDRIAVMQNGRIVELGDAREVFHHPQQEYTKMLLNSILEPKAYSEDRDS